MSRCTGCSHREDDKCHLDSCVYVCINEKVMAIKGIHIKNNIWFLDGKTYKIIDFIVWSNEYICLEVKY